MHFAVVKLSYKTNVLYFIMFKILSQIIIIYVFEFY